MGLPALNRREPGRRTEAILETRLAHVRQGTRILICVVDLGKLKGTADIVKQPTHLRKEKKGASYKLLKERRIRTLLWLVLATRILLAGRVVACPRCAQSSSDERLATCPRCAHTPRWKSCGLSSLRCGIATTLPARSSSTLRNCRNASVPRLGNVAKSLQLAY